MLLAQAVPGATTLPCVLGLPSGSNSQVGTIRTGQARFTLTAGKNGDEVVAVTLPPTSDTSTRAAASDQPGPAVRRPGPGIRTAPPLRFPVGCVTYQFSESARTNQQLVALADATLDFVPRTRRPPPDQPPVTNLTAGYDRMQLALCGAGVSCPGG